MRLAPAAAQASAMAAPMPDVAPVTNTTLPSSPMLPPICKEPPSSREGDVPVEIGTPYSAHSDHAIVCGRKMPVERERRREQRAGAAAGRFAEEAMSATEMPATSSAYAYPLLI